MSDNSGNFSLADQSQNGGAHNGNPAKKSKEQYKKLHSLGIIFGKPHSVGALRPERCGFKHHCGALEIDRCSFKTK